ncbi:hypothetical protein OESDEN_06165 [Oesophagostomum dentatum]|uniref:Uncharacterized protein n=1 Tax=Oesophagostomum dentatum TaxID=61180 RepID=A0A0B1TEU8_OESDE|nr:hypothetical protein OESDEN_06165 [Oesophagostomum dentatum]
MNYDCILEALAYMHMQYPEYSEYITKDMDWIPLVYEQRSEYNQYNLEEITRAAVKDWTPWLKVMCRLKSFGCNFMTTLPPRFPSEPAVSFYTHKITCLFFFIPV